MAGPEIYLKNQAKSSTIFTFTRVESLEPISQARWIEHPIFNRDGSRPHYTGSNDTIIEMSGILDDAAERNTMQTQMTTGNIYYLNADSHDTNKSMYVYLIDFTAEQIKGASGLFRFTLIMRKYT